MCTLLSLSLSLLFILLPSRMCCVSLSRVCAVFLCHMLSVSLSLIQSRAEILLNPAEAPLIMDSPVSDPGSRIRAGDRVALVLRRGFHDAFIDI